MQNAVLLKKNEKNNEIYNMEKMANLGRFSKGFCRP